jgi:hypothetical protein
MEFQTAIYKLAALAVAVLLTLLPLLVIRALVPRSIRRRFKAAETAEAIVCPLRGVFRFVTLTSTREQALTAQQVVLPNFPLSPLEFFTFVQAAFENRQVPEVHLSVITRRELGIFSSRRRYLHLSYQTSLCIIGAMPLGTAFVISWRLGEIASWARLVLVEHPTLHLMVDWFLRPPTFYRLDVNTAFQQLARQVIADAVDQITQVRGLRPINEIERRQILPWRV